VGRTRPQTLGFIGERQLHDPHPGTVSSDIAAGCIT
jgi:hypothetical protein